MKKLKNKYARRARISERKFRELIRYFTLDFTALDIARLSNLNPNTVDRYILLIRMRIAELCERESCLRGEVEIDESYFGPRRVRGKRGRGAGLKTAVFGIYERGGRVYTEIVPDCSWKWLKRVIRGKIPLDSVVHSDGWKAYDGLVDLGYQKHFRVRHGDGEFVRGNNHINGIESFWSFAKARLSKFNGIAPGMLYFHLKESEFRFNHRKDNLYAILLELLRNSPLN